MSLNHNLIKGADIRNNQQILNNLPKEGLCKCWARRKELEIILGKLNLNFAEIHNQLVNEGDYFCIFVGARNSLRKRVQEHLNGPDDKSTLWKSIRGLLGYAPYDFMDNLYFECIDENQLNDTRETAKNKLLEGDKFYVLNIDDNKHKLAKKVKPILSKSRKK